MGSPAPATTPTRKPIKEETAFILLVGVAVVVRLLERLLHPLERAAGEKAERASAATSATPRRGYRIYTATSLEESLGRFEWRYGVASDVFYERYAAGEHLPEGLSRHSANEWAGAWEEFRRLRDEELHAEDVFRPAGPPVAI